MGDGVSLSRPLAVRRLAAGGTFIVLTFRHGFGLRTSEPTQSLATILRPLNHRSQSVYS